MGMDEPLRVFTIIVLLASAAYVVVTNLQFRRHWPELVERCRRRVTSFGIEAAALPAVESDRNFMVLVASFTGALSGALAGLLLNASLMVLVAPQIDRDAGSDILVGAAFGALAFAILANEK